MLNKAMMLTGCTIASGETMLLIGAQYFGGGATLYDVYTGDAIVVGSGTIDYEENSVAVLIGTQYRLDLNNVAPALYTITEAYGVTVDVVNFTGINNNYCYFTVTGSDPRLIIQGESSGSYN